MIYKIDKDGLILGEYENVNDAAMCSKTSPQNVRQSLHHGFCVNKRYYFDTVKVRPLAKLSEIKCQPNINDFSALLNYRNNLISCNDERLTNEILNVNKYLRHAN